LTLLIANCHTIKSIQSCTSSCFSFQWEMRQKEHLLLDARPVELLPTQLWAEWRLQVSLFEFPFQCSYHSDPPNQAQLDEHSLQRPLKKQLSLHSSPPAVLVFFVFIVADFPPSRRRCKNKNLSTQVPFLAIMVSLVREAFLARPTL
jgi:hypothetical protein